MALSLDDFTVLKVCDLVATINSLPEADVEVARQALNGDVKNFPATKFASVISRASGRNFGEAAVRRHRTKACACPKD